MLLPVFILLTSLAMAQDDVCFVSVKQAELKAHIWENYSKSFVMKMLGMGKKAGLVKIKVDRCTGCLSFEGDNYLIGVFKEEFREKIKPELPVPLDQDLPGIPVDVSIGGLMPYSIQTGRKIFHAHYVPFLRFPGKTKNVFYDADKNPIEASARIVHPELIEFTFKNLTRKHVQVYRIGEGLSCIFPPENKEDKFDLQQFYMKEDDRFLPLKYIGMKSFIRDFIPPEVKKGD